MKIAKYYSHLNGHEWLLVHKKHLWKEIQEVIKSVDANELDKKISKEVRMEGKELYSPKNLNAALAECFTERDWRESRTDYWVTDDYQLIRKTMGLPTDQQKAVIEAAKKTPIYSYNQTDFVKERVAVEVQLGKYSFIAYDLFVKHLAFYVGDKIDLGVEILPMKSMQAMMSSGPGYYEGALYDLARQGRGVPGVPLVLIGIEP